MILFKQHYIIFNRSKSTYLILKASQMCSYQLPSVNLLTRQITFKLLFLLTDNDNIRSQGHLYDGQHADKQI